MTERDVGTRWLLHRTDNVVVNNNSVRIFERRANGQFVFTEYLIQWQMYGERTKHASAFTVFKL